MAVFATFMYPHLMVNLQGERFMDEEASVITPFGGNAIARQKEGCAFSIFDEEMKIHFVENGLDFPAGFGIAQFGGITTEATNFDAEIEQIIEKGSDSIFMADSLEELASMTGIDPDGLRKTVEEYNHACETGRDLVLGKKARYLQSVKRPRFYASKRFAMSRGTPEGIRINHRTEVLTEDFDVIPGLYAVGMDAACNIYRDVYPNVLPGNAMGFSIGSGRIAAENAIEYMKSMTR
jgi:fumarate reductase flavoprotein subunit